MNAAIAAGDGEYAHDLIAPTADVTVAAGSLPTLGTVNLGTGAHTDQVLGELLAIADPLAPTSARDGFWATHLLPVADALSGAEQLWDTCCRRGRSAAGAGPGSCPFRARPGPDPLGRDQTALTLAARQALAYQRWTFSGGCSPNFYIGMAASLGVTISIETFQDTPCGNTVCGDALAPEGEPPTWQITMPAALVNEAICGVSVCGDCLGKFRLRPAARADQPVRAAAHAADSRCPTRCWPRPAARCRARPANRCCQDEQDDACDPQCGAGAGRDRRGGRATLSSFPTTTPASTDLAPIIRPCSPPGTSGCPATGFANYNVTLPSLAALLGLGNVPGPATIGSSSVNYWIIAGSATQPTLAVSGGGSSGKFVGLGAGTGLFIANSADTDHLEIYPGSGGGGPWLNCTGPETTVNCSIRFHGAAGLLEIYSDTSSDYLGIGDSSTAGSGADLTSGGPETSVNANIQPKGYGNVFFYEQSGSQNAVLSIGPYQFSGALPGPIIQLGNGASVPANAPLVLSATKTDGSGTGPVVSLSPFARQASVKITSGASYTVVPGLDIVILSGVSSTFALTAPAAPYGGQEVELLCDTAVTTLSFLANSGQTVVGAATSCGATQGHAWRYLAADASWHERY